MMKVCLRERNKLEQINTDYIIVILFYTRDGNIMTIKMTLYVVYWCIVFGIEYEISVKGGKNTVSCLTAKLVHDCNKIKFWI